MAARYSLAELTEAADRAIRALTPPVLSMHAAACPRCNATGEELMFMRFHTCQVCNGAKRIPQITADAEIARRESERC